MDNFEELKKRAMADVQKDAPDVADVPQEDASQNTDESVPLEQPSPKSILRADMQKVKHLFQGRLVSNDVLARQWKNIALCVFLILLYITNRYACQQKIAEIGQLQKQLVDVRYEALTLSSTLMGASRQSQVQELIIAKGLDLEEIKEAPFRIYKSKDTSGK